MNGVIRPLKSGGYSICRSPEELVGKGRCKHKLGISFKLKDDGSMVCNVGEEETKDEKQINNYLKSLGDTISEEKKEKILMFFEDFNK